MDQKIVLNFKSYFLLYIFEIYLEFDTHASAL